MEMYCKVCKAKTKWNKGKAFLNSLVGYPDFIGDSYASTVSRVGPANLVEVSKCEECGHSFVGGDDKKEPDFLRDAVMQCIMSVIDENSGGIKQMELYLDVLSFFYKTRDDLSVSYDDITDAIDSLVKTGKLKSVEYTCLKFDRAKIFLCTP